MRVLIGTIILLLLALTGIGIFIYEEYRYPVCPYCGSNFYSKRIKGKIVCKKHGTVV